MVRTTVSLEDDLMAAIKSLAQARSVPIGEVLSELVRKALATNGKVSSRHGFPVFDVSPGGKPITLEDVRRAEDEGH